MLDRIRMLRFYSARYSQDRRRWRRMQDMVARPATLPMALVMGVLVMALLLWVFFPPAALADAGVLYVITASPHANIREAPDTSSVDLGDARQGDTVRGIYTDGWVLATGELLADGTEIRLSVEPSRGYIRADLLTLADPDYPVGRYANVSGGRVNIRRKPNGTHADWLETGKHITVQRWVAVDGEAWAVTAKGYILGSCLEAKGDAV